jgi:23S rRNA pseudouridine1911/1915/1917 synthase
MSFTHHLLTVPEACHLMRADKVVADLMDHLSRSYIQTLFEQGYVKHNDKILNKKDKVCFSDTIDLQLPDRPEPSISAVDLPVQVIYEDSDIILINKDPGWVTHPGSGTGDDTLVHALLHHTQGQLSRAGGDKRPGVVHRLDKETSGVMIFAKSDAAYLNLIEAFASRTIQKTYTAIIKGTPRLCSGKIEAPIDRNSSCRVKMAVAASGKPARTDWEVCERFQDHTRLNLWLHTGRTHQIRVHLSYLGHPIVGDKTYGWRPKPMGPVPERVLLHAQTLAFNHPITGLPLVFEAPVPIDMIDFMKQLNKV